MSKLRVIVVLFLTLNLLPCTVLGAPGFEIHFLDVGQADAAIVICDDQTMLIDGGNVDDSRLLFTYLKNTLRVAHLKYIFCTHAHEDHVGGIAAALNACTVGTIFSPVTHYSSEPFMNFLKYAERQGETLRIPRPGEFVTLGSATVQVLGPVSAYREENNTSIVLKISYGDTSFLFMADAEESSEDDILGTHDQGIYNLEATLLKIGHHGGPTSSSITFLKAVSPRYAVISVGAGNSYGHPSKNLMGRLDYLKIRVYRTDLQGHIVCVSDGNELTFITEK